jgi:hypothetical protein
MMWEDQIKLAIKLLRPTAAEKDHCDEYIRYILNELWLADTGPLPKPYRDALGKQLRAARRFAAAQKETSRFFKAIPDEKPYGPDLSLHIELLTTQLAKPERKPVNTQQEAAAQARDLLEAYGRPVTTTPRGEWCKLAAILNGTPNKRMDRHCRAVQPRSV